MYNAEIKDSDLVFRRPSDNKELFSVPVASFSSFCPVVTKQILPFAVAAGSEKQDEHAQSEHVLYYLKLTPAASHAAKFSMLEEAKRAIGHSALQHEIEDRQLIDVASFPYDDLAKRLHGFAKIGAFCHNYPGLPASSLDRDVFKKRLLTLAVTKGAEEEGGLVRVFDMKALGFDADDARDHFDVWKTDMLIHPDAIEYFEDHGAYRVIHPKPDCFPETLRGEEHRALREMATPETMEALKARFAPMKPAGPKSTL